MQDKNLRSCPHSKASVQLIGLREKKGHSNISWENLWFPVDSPLSQPIDQFFGFDIICTGSYRNSHAQSVVPDVRRRIQRKHRATCGAIPFQNETSKLVLKKKSKISIAQLVDGWEIPVVAPVEAPYFQWEYMRNFWISQTLRIAPSYKVVPQFVSVQLVRF